MKKHDQLLSLEAAIASLKSSPKLSHFGHAMDTDHPAPWSDTSTGYYMLAAGRSLLDVLIARAVALAEKRRTELKAEVLAEIEAERARIAGGK